MAAGAALHPVHHVGAVEAAGLAFIQGLAAEVAFLRSQVEELQRHQLPRRLDLLETTQLAIGIRVSNLEQLDTRCPVPPHDALPSHAALGAAVLAKPDAKPQSSQLEVEMKMVKVEMQDMSSKVTAPSVPALSVAKSTAPQLMPAVPKLPSSLPASSSLPVDLFDIQPVADAKAAGRKAQSESAQEDLLQSSDPWAKPSAKPSAITEEKRPAKSMPSSKAPGAVPAAPASAGPPAQVPLPVKAPPSTGTFSCSVPAPAAQSATPATAPLPVKAPPATPAVLIDALEPAVLIDALEAPPPAAPAAMAAPVATATSAVPTQGRLPVKAPPTAATAAKAPPQGVLLKKAPPANIKGS